MSAVPPKTLEWLYRVLTSRLPPAGEQNRHDPRQAYADPNRAYNDAAHLLSQHPHFSPRTDVYTYENGASALLLHASGTLPVTFRGAMYRFPITVWVPHRYPREPPMVYVTPTQDMLVRPGQHVSGDGRVYHHYLAHWAEAADRSTIIDFMYILRDIFTKEPPVISKQAQAQAQNARPQPQRAETPPAVPPLPTELARRSEPQSPQAEQQPQAPVPPQVPPKPPPKPDESLRAEESRQPPAPQERYQKPPPVPPLPSDYQQQPQPKYYEQQGYTQPRNVPPHQPHVPSALRRLASPTQLHESAAGPPNGTYSSQDMRSPVSPIVEPGEPAQPSRQSASYPPHAQPQPQPQTQLPYNGTQYAQPPSHGYQQAPPYHPQSLPVPPGYQAPPPGQRGPAPPVPPHPAPQQPKKAATPDLLTSPFELELHDPAASSAPPPPIPPNPEKDALLQNLSRTLTQTLQSSVEKTNSGLQPLHSQSKALQNAMVTLQSEIGALNNLHATLQSNVSILQHSLQQADGVIADAQARLASSEQQKQQQPTSATDAAAGKPAGLPPIDEVLVAPTVVGKQVYDLVADERGIQRALYALHVGLVKGRVGVDTWARHTRGLAREAFLKKALIRKAGEGMGLNVEGAT